MFIANYPVRFSDIDAAGIVYYPRFFYFCHQAFEDFFNEKSSFSYASMINEKKFGFPVVNIKSNFIKPLAFGDHINVRVKINKIGTSSLSCSYEIFLKDPTSIHFKAEITTVCVDLISHKSMPIPDDIKNFLQEYLG